jgi:hypothetical protein
MLVRRSKCSYARSTKVKPKISAEQALANASRSLLYCQRFPYLYHEPKFAKLLVSVAKYSNSPALPQSPEALLFLQSTSSQRIQNASVPIPRS